MAENLLDSFLSIASDELIKASTSKRQLKETDLFSQETNLPNNLSKHTSKKSAIHSGDTDSSDDEDHKYYEEQKYNQCGRDVKHLLKTSEPESALSHRQEPDVSWKSKPANLAKSKAATSQSQDVYTDPIFGIRIVNPLVSFASLKERMVGRETVPYSMLKRFTSTSLSEKNWVIGGVIANKSAVRTSQKGNQFLIWTLTDLKDDIKTVSMFLFGSAYKQYWKTTTGVVVGILNPGVLDKKDGSKDEATLSVDNAQKIMILGQSKDLGRCKSTRKDGDQCTSIVNKNRCEFCLYHIKQEYQKCSLRSELQANFSGKGLIALRNKVLGKNEVFYAGKSYTAIPAKRSKKLIAKDENRLMSLAKGSPSIANPAGIKNVTKAKRKAAANIEVSAQQRLKDLALLERLGGGEVKLTKETFNASHSSEPTLESAKKTVTEVLTKLKENKETSNVEIEHTKKDLPKIDETKAVNYEATANKKVANKADEIKIVKNDLVPKNLPLKTPQIFNLDKGVIDLNVKISSKDKSRAKMNAIKFIKKNPLQKVDPNSVKKTPESKKRVMQNLENVENPSKKPKTEENEFLSERFKKIMAASSKHVDLLEERDNEEQEKYFHKLEMKEKMEEKMIGTYKVACKAVSCLKCKYTNFSASQFCKDNKHPLRVFDAMKRFFKCGNCGKRTQSLEIVPTISCNNCGSGKWERTGMMKEKTVKLAQTLSIRGGEQTFVNSVVSDANLDLLVPDS